MHASDALPRLSDRLRRLALIHLGSFALFASWAFGGQAPFARELILWWGAAGIGLCAMLSLRSGFRTAGRFLWPLALYDGMVAVGCLNPGFRETLVDGQISLVMIDPNPWLPSVAVPRLALRELWQFNGIVLSCFNLLLVVEHRRQIRTLLFVLAANAVTLAIFGTFQKLAGSSGLWFGAVPSPNKRFFATFIYHNHWGSFALLGTAACLALLFHFLGRSDHRNLWHSPVPMGAVATLLLALSVPLSASRSCSVLIVVLIMVAGTHYLRWLIRHRHQTGRARAPAIAATVLAGTLALAAIGYLSRDVIAQRAQTTGEQLSRLAEERTLTSRLVLYHDTWNMAAQKPWFGWGLESYARVFRIFNTQRTTEKLFWIPFYAEAHNDWLQSLAEVGFVGTGLLGLLLLIPLRSVRWRATKSPVPRYLLGGCLLLLLYAWLEFPFANPAVVLTFFVLFYGGVAYGRLSQPRPTSNVP